MIYSVPRDIAWAIDENHGDPVLYLMRVPDGTPLALTGTAGLIWLLAIEEDDVVGALNEVICDPPADLDQITRAYLDDLTSRGLLVREESA